MKSRLGYFFLVTVLMIVPSASGYIGSQLSRGPVESFTLTDQNGDEYSLLNDSDGVVVVSFIFTRCPDVCPVLTQQLTSVEMNCPKENLRMYRSSQSQLTQSTTHQRHSMSTQNVMVLHGLT